MGSCLRGGLPSGSGHNDSGSGSHCGCGDAGWSGCVREVGFWRGSEEEKSQGKGEGNGKQEQRDRMPMFVWEYGHDMNASGNKRFLGDLKGHPTAPHRRRPRS